MLWSMAGLPIAARPDDRRSAGNSSDREIRQRFRDLPKAMWAWKIDAPALADLRSFCEAETIDTVLLSISGPFLDALAADNAAVVDNLRGLKESGVSVRALAGDPSWCRARHLPDFLRKLVDVMEHRDGLFDGLSLDVEPNALDAWHSDASRRELMDETIAFFEMVRAHVGSLKLDISVNPVFARLTTSDGRNFLEEIVRRANSVDLMAYRNTAERAVQWAEGAIRVIEASSLQWRFGVLVHPSRERGTSYAGTDTTSFMAQMIELDRRLGRSSAAAKFRGAIFEDFHALRALF